MTKGAKWKTGTGRERTIRCQHPLLRIARKQNHRAQQQASKPRLQHRTMSAVQGVGRCGGQM
eukprot:357581-Chlamydomonas_euryale.AAC.2